LLLLTAKHCVDDDYQSLIVAEVHPGVQAPAHCPTKQPIESFMVRLNAKVEGRVRGGMGEREVALDLR
jgi:hypothetical protein